MSNATQTELGSVVSLWRYPVKSMMGEELNATEVTERGLLGDRAYAVVDSSDGKVATAKNPRKWPNLFDFRATFIEPPRASPNVPPVRITLPDGTIATSQQSDVNQVLSKALDRKVALYSAERLGEDLVGVTLLTGGHGAVRQCDPDRRPVRAGARRLDEGSPEVEEIRPFSGVLGGRDFSIGAVHQRISTISQKSELRNLGGV